MKRPFRIKEHPHYQSTAQQRVLSRGFIVDIVNQGSQSIIAHAELDRLRQEDINSLKTAGYIVQVQSI